MDYEGKKEELAKTVQSIHKEQKDQLEKLKKLAMEMDAIKIATGESKKIAGSPAFDKALKDAKEIEQKYGVHSKEAMMAYAELEDVAAADNSNAYGPRLDEECLVDTAMEACQALDELNRVLGEINK